MLWCLKTPRGSLVEETADTDRGACWKRAFQDTSRNRELENAWGSRFWEECPIFQKVLSKKGFRLVRCKLVEVKKKARR